MNATRYVVIKLLKMLVWTCYTKTEELLVLSHEVVNIKEELQLHSLILNRL